MTNPREGRVGASTHRRQEPVDLDVDLSRLDVQGLRALLHRAEEELAAREPAEPPDAPASLEAVHGNLPADPSREHRLRQLLIRIDEEVAGRRDTPEQPTGE